MTSISQRHKICLDKWGAVHILIHAYFGIDLDVVWDIVKNKIPELKEKVEKIASNLKSGELR